jgi:asparagine synthase (glutamine-hydrolysing)
MAVSLETRIPMLDHRVVEFALSLPDNLKIRRGQGKWILRQVLFRHVPRQLVERPKSGFAIPLAAWLRGPLRGWAESLLTAGEMHSSGLLDSAAVRRLWEEHQTGRADHHTLLWNILTLQAWLAHLPPQPRMLSS